MERRHGGDANPIEAIGPSITRRRSSHQSLPPDDEPLSDEELELSDDELLSDELEPLSQLDDAPPPPYSPPPPENAGADGSLGLLSELESSAPSSSGVM